MKGLFFILTLVVIQVTSMLGLWPATWASAVLFFVATIFIWLCVSMAVATCIHRRLYEPKA